MNTSFLLRRVLPALIILALAVGAWFWFTRSKPITVVLKAVDRGNVESTVVNTRAGTVEACLRTKLSTIMGGRIKACFGWVLAMDWKSSIWRILQLRAIDLSAMLAMASR